MNHEDMEKLVHDAVADVLGQREEILRAFIAKYGFEPDEAIQVIGPNFWFIRKRLPNEKFED